MLRMTRLTDYAVALLARFVVEPGRHSAREMAVALRLPAPAVSKVLKILARAGILQTHRGKKGGFTLATPARQITVAQVLRAFEGPLAITDCSGAHPGGCEVESRCLVGDAWKRINRAMEAALGEINLEQLVAGGPDRFDGLSEAVRGRVVGGTLKV
jgi:FeS assembly SUF system regulator